MPESKSNDTSSTKISFTALLNNYKKLQQTVVNKITSLASNSTTTDPSAFLMVQFQMSLVTQAGESISNLIAQVSSLINASIRNQKTQ